MFVPKKFAIDDMRELDALIDRDAFATLVTTHDGAPFATHLPVICRREGDRIFFTGHWAKANPQWRDSESRTALLIVHGPHAYMSPTWYAQPQTSVPTWNYTAAHAYGRITLIREPGPLARLVAELAAIYEAKVGSDWRFPDSAPGTVHELAGIVGFEMAVERIEIKHKLNQHHPVGNVLGAIRGLRERGDAGSTEIADLMERSLHAREATNRD
jgi:transcriptional regulator